jgi:hypothetical protein
MVDLLPFFVESCLSLMRYRNTGTPMQDTGSTRLTRETTSGSETMT